MNDTSHSPVFRVFISSTFEDFHEQRNYLQKNAFAELAKFCESNGGRFQAIDLRWGVSGEAGLAHNTLQICLEEIERCRNLTPKPNFLALVGFRYGWVPVPAVIPEEEYKILRKAASAEGGELLDNWYRRDENAVPAEYVLRRREGDSADNAFWKAAEKALRETLQQAVAAVGWQDDPKRRSRYCHSATHREMEASFLHNVDAAKEHAVAFVTPFSENAEYDSGMILTLREEIASALPEDRVMTLPAALEELNAAVYESLREVIQAEIDLFRATPPPNRERALHHKFAKDLTKVFFGRKAERERIGRYLAGEGDAPRRPLFVVGESGVGKTALLARSYLDSLDNGFQSVAAFVGASAASLSRSSLLAFLCGELEAPLGAGETLSLKDLIVKFKNAIAAASPERHLTIFVDAIDQLDRPEDPELLKWLPEELPANVRLVVSVLSRLEEEGDTAYTTASRIYSQEDFLEVPLLDEVDAEKALSKSLANAGRQLQPGQMELVLSRFRQDGRPLYLKVLFEQARRWTSFTSTEEIIEAIATDAESAIHAFFQLLSKPEHHGAPLVTNVLALLAASRAGLEETELVKLLAANAVYFEHLISTSICEIPKDSQGTIPIAVWSRLHSELRPFLSERSADGAMIVNFYHRLIYEAAKTFVSPDRHLELARYFERQPDFLDAYPNLRKITEYAYQLEAGGKSQSAVEALSERTLLEAYSQAGRLPDYFDSACRSLLKLSDGGEGDKSLTKLANTIVWFTASRPKLGDAQAAIITLSAHLGFRKDSRLLRKVVDLGREDGNLRALLEGNSPFWITDVAIEFQMRKVEEARRDGDLEGALEALKKVLEYQSQLPQEDKGLQKAISLREYEASYICWLLDDLPGDLAHLEASAEAALRADDELGAAFARETAALHLFLQGDFSEDSAAKALAEIDATRKVFALSDTARGKRWHMNCAVHSLEIHFHRGNAEGARREFKAFESDPWYKSNWEHMEADYFRYHALALATEKNWPLTLQEYERFIDLKITKAARPKAVESSSRYYFELGRIQELSGDLEASGKSYQLALQQADSMGNGIWKRNSQKQLGIS